MISGKSAFVYAGEYVCALLPNSSNARRASYTELAVECSTYSRNMGNERHMAKDLKARIISTPARSATLFINVRFFLNSSSSMI